VNANWFVHGLCSRLEPEAFFADDEAGVATAKATCRSCPVQPECLDWALEKNERHGVWGGLTGSERDRLRHSEGALTTVA